jgi:DNA modification methylase
MRAVRNRLLVGDARQLLRTLPDASIDCIVTSPPFFRLRDYSVDGQIGLEASADAWVAELRAISLELARVLAPHGGLWLNLGDAYARHLRDGAPPKSLLLAPERLALALVEDGWRIRSKVIWAKTNAMPTSVRDRLACTWEVIYFAVRSHHYFFDLDAIRIPHRSTMQRASAAAARRAERARSRPGWAGPLAGTNRGLDRLKARGRVGHPLGKNPGDVWTHATSNHRGAHHAMFPPDLIRRPILAGCPERVCKACRQPWQRNPARTLGHLAVRGELQPVCRCAATSRPGVVLDPFIGAGTTAIVAEEHNRDWIGIELNPEFARLAVERIGQARENRAPPEEIAA